jgi:DNA-binding CsgD family transcriptional regulator
MDRTRLDTLARRAPFAPVGVDPSAGESEVQRFARLAEDPILSPLADEVTRICAELGFERHVAWVLWPAQGMRRSTFVTNYSPDWMRRRLRNSYHSHDPIRLRAAQTGRPFSFRDVMTRHLTEGQAQVMEEARTFGLRTGGAMMRKDDQAGRICFCVSTVTSDEDFDALFAARQPELNALMSTISHKFRSFQNAEATRSAAPILTPHECEALMFAARGLTTQRTAKAMGISDYTVKDHLKSAQEKLGAKNRTEAVAKAMILGFIMP